MGFYITDWELFEIKGDQRCTKKFKSALEYVSVPTDFNTPKVVELLATRNGLASLGLFILLLEAWANQDRENRKGGTIHSWESGKPATEHELARMFRMRKDTLSTLTKPLIAINWIGVLHESSEELHE